ncbi:MAG: ABC transporter substrate-binding protein [Acidimicrobiales bacterium]
MAESIEPNDDYTRWTITLRDGVTFQNGESLDAGALALFIPKGMRQSPLTGRPWPPVDETTPAVATGPMTVEVTMTQPWATYPWRSPARAVWSRPPSSSPNPDAAWRSDNPIGTGPFALQEWSEGSRLTLDRNDAYWQDGLPYLDNVAFVPISDNNARDDALLRGDVDMEFTTFSSSVQRLEPLARAADQLVLDSGGREQLFLLMNNDKAPFDDVRIRKAVALAFDYDTYLQVAKEPDAIRSEGPFTRSSPWFVDTDFPTYDLEAAKALVAEYEAEVGPAAFEFRTTDNPENQAIGQAIADMLTAAGMDVTTTSESQTSYPTSIVFGAYELAYVQVVRLASRRQRRTGSCPESAPPVGQGTIGLNLARMRDAQVDEAIMRGRTPADRNERAEAYADLQRRLTELVQPRSG